MRTLSRKSLLAVLVAGAFLAASPARATHRDVKAVMTTGAYGILGGTVLGLVAYPFTKDVKKIFMGSSIGLYLGIVVGIYFIHNRYDEGNPLHMPREERPPWENSGGSGSLRSDQPGLATERPLLQGSWVVARF